MAESRKGRRTKPGEADGQDLRRAMAEAGG